MKKINVIAWLITLLMTLVSSPAVAASGTNYEVEVGKTLRLDISSFGVECMVNGSSYTWEITQAYVGDDTNYSEYLTFTSKSKNYAVVKGLKAGKLISVTYTGYYYYNGTRKEFSDAFYVRVVASGTPSTGPASLEVFPTPQTLKVGETKWVYVKQTRAIGGTYFYSEDESIASVTRGELASANSYTTAAQITAKKAGKVNIVAKNVNGLTDICEVTVTALPVTSVSIPSSLSLEVGGTYTLTPSVIPSNAETSFTWSSDNSNVATVSQSGKVTAKNAGIANIKVTMDNGKTATCKVTVNAPVAIVDDEPVVTTENTMALGNVTANTGTTVTFPIGLHNVDEITALQMDLHLPSGITLATDEDGDVKIETTDRVSIKHTVDCSKMADGSYRVICYSTKNNTFTGNSGDLFSLSLIVSSELTDGDYEITATNIELSDNTGTAYSGLDVKGVVTVKSYILGDVDGNGQHSINDVVCIINHVLNRPNTTFIEVAADLDGNGEISVNDAVLLISQYILGTSSNARKATRAAVINSEENYMRIEDVTMQPGEVKTIGVVMINERDDIRGMQCDITLPEGISFLYDEDVEDYVTASARIPKKLAMSSEMQNENMLRVAGVCTGSSSIYGNTGSVFTFKVKADEHILAGMYEIQLSNVELSYGEAIGVADRSSVLEILNDAAGIATLHSNGESRINVYDLSGRRVDESMTKKGIYIINGKKVIVR